MSVGAFCVLVRSKSERCIQKSTDKSRVVSIFRHMMCRIEFLAPKNKNHNNQPLIRVGKLIGRVAAWRSWPSSLGIAAKLVVPPWNFCVRRCWFGRCTYHTYVRTLRRSCSVPGEEPHPQKPTYELVPLGSQLMQQNKFCKHARLWANPPVDTVVTSRSTLCAQFLVEEQTKHIPI